MVLSFYIRKQITPSTIPSFVMPDQSVRRFAEGIFPMNILRDMAIESIDTSHYVLVDIDVFTSSTLEEDIVKNRRYLDDHHNALLIPLFEMVNTRRVLNCKWSGNCVGVWQTIPMNKVGMKRSVSNKHIKYHRSVYHAFITQKEWMSAEPNRLTFYPPKLDIEPYGVFRRSPLDPIFNPYFINYGYDKIEFFERIVMYNQYKYYVLVDDFGVDIPHSPSPKAKEFSKKLRDDPMRVLMGTLRSLYNYSSLVC